MRKLALSLFIAMFLVASLTIVKPADSETTKPAENTWTEKAPMHEARYDFGVAVVDGKIYAIGGAPQPGKGYSNTVEEYDPQTNTWTNKTPMPTARSEFTTAVYLSLIHI